MWVTLNNNGTVGSEGGIVCRDEEYKKSCRITMERCAEKCAVTCGIYGLMSHTAFAAEADAEQLYADMKSELQIFIDRETTELDEILFVQYFTQKF